jgi:DNA-binding transcriptional LysR family regulator
MEEEPVSLVTGRHHPLVQASDLTGRLLLDYDWLLPGPGAILRETVLSRLTALGLPAPSGQIATSSFLLTLAMLQQSDAIAPLASAVARRFADGVDTPYAILPMDLGIRVTPYGLITRAGGRLTPAANRLRNLILSAP